MVLGFFWFFVSRDVTSLCCRYLFASPTGVGPKQTKIYLIINTFKMIMTGN